MDKRRARWTWPAVVAAISMLAVSPASAKTMPGTMAGALTVERPTLVSLGFEWRITGDDNRNAKVELSYRKHGETRWRQALPLLRLQGEEVSGGKPRNSDWGRFYDYVAPNMFAGSLLNLQPDTAYEVRLVRAHEIGRQQAGVGRRLLRAGPAPGIDVEGAPA